MSRDSPAGSLPLHRPRPINGPRQPSESPDQPDESTTRKGPGWQGPGCEYRRSLCRLRSCRRRDDATALAFQQLLAERWATATAERATREADQPGVRLRCYLDLRQPLDS
ncbi:DUF6207 family protein [Streptomyces canus]|uniref:DUF6207 family protein n=1 Tax=Streptomyces canus TaxID=58343 RepID=UPI002DD8AFF7|nr:DUF6207 family protein [Streptomyces canus]WSD92474.1 DUF6207 family protein [Streptomyces canus]